MTTVVIATVNWSRRPEFGGLMWVPLNWALGLRDLGVRVYWIDHLKRVDPFRKDHTLDHLWCRFDGMMRRFGLQGSCGIVYDDGAVHLGHTAEELGRLTRDADLLLALGRTPPESSPLMEARRRAYVDIDPGFTQIWATQRDTGLRHYDDLFTVGQNVGRDGFSLPTNGVEWKPILPPVHLPSWPARIDETCQRVSTVADWRGDQKAELDGQVYGSKRSEFIRYLQVPMLTGQRIELALCIGQQDYQDLGLLSGHDWRVRDPYQFAGDAEAFREFVQESRAEFAVAKHGYVESNSGWFSDRTACYLAAGKPAIVQSTGFEGHLPTGEGLITFASVEEAVHALHDLESSYLEHCRAARAFAETHLDAEKILSRVLSATGIAVEEVGRSEGVPR